MSETPKQKGGAAVPVPLVDQRLDALRAEVSKVPEDVRSAVLELYATETPTRTIAMRFGLGESYVRKLASRHGVRKGSGLIVAPAPAMPKCNGEHIQAHRRAQRGFHVPPHLEPVYIELLVQGMSRKAAAVVLGLHGMGS